MKSTNEHDRHSIRLRAYDYSLAGMYFVTVCVSERTSLFARVTDGEMGLNPAGTMVHSVLEEMPGRYSGVGVDSFVVMPNHVHSIIVLTEGPVGAGTGPPAEMRQGRTREDEKRLTLGDVVQRFKSITFQNYRTGVLRGGWTRYVGTLWQRDYYEHIIRDGESLARIREYIKNNPRRWELDRENPKRTGEDPFDMWLDSFIDRPGVDFPVRAGDCSKTRKPAPTWPPTRHGKR